MGRDTRTTTAYSSRATARPRARHFRLVAVATGAAALSLAGAGLAAQVASAAPAQAGLSGVLDAGHAGRFGAVLVDSHGLSLYTLADSAGKMVCTGKCLGFWPPLIVGKSTTHVTLGPGVTGEVGFLPFSKTSKEVTFDGYPVYTFVKDTGPGQSHGEGIVAFGGTWELLRPAALVAPPTAPASKATTTTSASSGYK